VVGHHTGSAADDLRTFLEQVPHDNDPTGSDRERSEAKAPRSLPLLGCDARGSERGDAVVVLGTFRRESRPRRLLNYGRVLVTAELARPARAARVKG
jgi:hypothetical protein